MIFTLCIFVALVFLIASAFVQPDTFWRIAARVATRNADAIRRRAFRTPYRHITSADGQDVYMGRWWLFNPYPHGDDGDNRRWAWLPSIRVHHIMRPDSDRHLHDHPWNARTIILRGWYIEERKRRGLFKRTEGDTETLRYGEFHRITEVSPGGVWTLFIVWRKQGAWGFDVDGVKVPWREYLDGKPQ